MKARTKAEGGEDHIWFEAYPDGGRLFSGGQTIGIHGGVKAVHGPSGVTAIVNVGRSQDDNKAIAEKMILTAITHPKFR